MCIPSSSQQNTSYFFLFSHAYPITETLTSRCSNAKQGPHAAYNAYKQFVQVDTTALFLAAAMEHFNLDDVSGI